VGSYRRSKPSSRSERHNSQAVDPGSEILCRPAGASDSHECTVPTAGAVGYEYFVGCANSLLLPRDNSQPVGLEFDTVKRPLGNILRFRSVIALALMLWCAGAGCMLVRSARATTADSETQSTSEAEGSTGSHGSCHGSSRPAKARKAHSNSGSPAGVKRLSLPAMPTSSGAMSCCPLTSGSIVTASRVQTNDDHLAAVSHDELSYLPFGTRGSAPLAIPLRLPNQDQTYLRCCVFLI
jgi:hypothetical protein